MEIEQIISNVQTQLGQTSVSERTIRDIIETFPVAEGTEPDEAYFGKIKKICVSANGNISAVASKAVTEAQTKWAQEHNGNNTPPPPAKSAEVLALEARLKALEDEGASRAVKAKADAVRANILKKGDELKVSKKTLWKDVVNGLEIGENADEEELLKKAKSNYTGKMKDYFGENAVPYSGRSPQQQQNDTDEAKAKREAFKLRHGGKKASKTE